MFPQAEEQELRVQAQRAGRGRSLEFLSQYLPVETAKLMKKRGDYFFGADQIGNATQ